VKADSNAIVKNRVKSISVYFIDHYFDAIPLKKLYATWEIESSSSAILRSRLKFIDSSVFYFSGLVNFTQVTYKKNKITEIKLPGPGDNRKLLWTHYLDREGKITNSSFRYLTKPYEDAYSFLDKIKYEYNEKGLLSSEKYINDWMRVDKNFCFLEVFFEYVYGP